MQSLSFSLRLCPSGHRLRASQRFAIQSDFLVIDEMKFIEASRKGNILPLHTCIFSDHLTPVLAYRCFVKEGDREAPSFLFESAEPGTIAATVGRYSVVGSQPAIEIVAKENKVTIMDNEKGSLTEKIVDDPMEIPKSISDHWKPQLLDELPDTFCGGWFGYFLYDSVHYVKKKLPFSKAPQDEMNLADMHLGLYDDVIVFDHVQKKAYVIHWVRLDQYSCVEKAYIDGMKRLEKLVSRVHDIDPPRISSGLVTPYPQNIGSSLKKSNMTSKEYKEKVLDAKEHISAGDIFQMVFSQRFECRTFADPFEVYRALRVVNPSPYMTYLQARGCILVASSPESLTRVKKVHSLSYWQNKIVNRPLAGTVIRGNYPHEDEIIEKQLLKDQKQCAENIMLADLGRNDVGKVSKSSSVNVEKLTTVEHYSHVTHISSMITGELLNDLSCWDAPPAVLPAGTVSGAPMVKAMEMIDELEITRRGPCSGGFGGISFTGDMDMALAIGTIVFPTGTRYDTLYSYKDTSKRREWVAYLQAGAEIVSKSGLEDEQTECEDEAAGLARAINLAESAFVEKYNPLGVKSAED